LIGLRKPIDPTAVATANISPDQTEADIWRQFAGFKAQPIVTGCIQDGANQTDNATASGIQPRDGNALLASRDLARSHP
jgi:hypothetical protein